ncbi:MAG TPA: hypothetical protein VH796_18695 [Nitrososphaeraceae archaeon]
MTLVVALVVGLVVVEHITTSDIKVAKAATVTPTSYNDGLVMGKNDCRTGHSYNTSGHTSVWISGYNDGWKAAGCVTHTETATSYNDGLVVGKNDCRTGHSYNTSGHTPVWISGYNDGWKSAGCRM